MGHALSHKIQKIGRILTIYIFNYQEKSHSSMIKQESIIHKTYGIIWSWITFIDHMMKSDTLNV